MPLADPQPPTDPFWAPLFLQQAVDAVPYVGRNGFADFGALPSQGETVGLLRAVPLPSLIPPHFPANGELVDCNPGGDLLIGMAHFQ